ncbi:MAG TPA: hypothetical protein VJN21_03995 [Candidatus Acidoferrales bacterium]|nr:hypothetical protein [Candidatus Acidoferrales bacterium]
MSDVDDDSNVPSGAGFVIAELSLSNETPANRVKGSDEITFCAVNASFAD